MAIKRICDKCGAEINPQTSAKVIKIYDYYGGIKEEKELCVSCHYHLKMWLGKQDV